MNGTPNIPTLTCELWTILQQVSAKCFTLCKALVDTWADEVGRLDFMVITNKHMDMKCLF